MNDKPRWQHRFDNYKNAFFLLCEGIELKGERALSDLEEEGIIQRFEYTWELAWKVLKDYLENDGVVLEKITPKTVIVYAIEAKIITGHEVWMSALDDRNKMSHQYNKKIFSEVIENIQRQYLTLFDALYEKLFTEIMQ